MPQPLPEKFGANQSLLFHPRVAEEANRLIAYANPELVMVLSAALSKTSGDHMYRGLFSKTFC